MAGFTKLYNSILDSSVWDEDVYTRILWVTMLAAVDPDGNVVASKSRLRAKANIPEKQFNKALQVLMAPDPESRTPDNEGRRIKEIQGGWELLNYTIYRNKRDSEDRKVYQRDWDRKNRPSGAKRAKVRQSDKVRQSPTQAEAEAEAEAEADKKKDIKKKLTFLDGVKLTEDEHHKLLAKFGADEAAERVQSLNGYIMSTGKRYKSHYHTILNWARKDEVKNIPKKLTITEKDKEGERLKKLAPDKLTQSERDLLYAYNGRQMFREAGGVYND